MSEETPAYKTGTEPPRMTTAETLTLLRYLEWNIRIWKHHHCCPICSRPQERGHIDGCGMDRLIQQTEQHVREVERLRAALQAIANLGATAIDGVPCTGCPKVWRIAREALEVKP